MLSSINGHVLSSIWTNKNQEKVRSKKLLFSKSKLMKVLAFGEVLWDFIDGNKFFGGAPVNFAAHVVQCGEEARIVTALGTERLGDQALEQIRNAGISNEFMQRVEDRVTARVMVLLNNGQPTYRIKKDVAYEYIDKTRIDLRSIARYDAFYFGTLAQRSSHSREALYHILRNGHFKTVFYNVNLRKIPTPKKQ